MGQLINTLPTLSNPLVTNLSFRWHELIQDELTGMETELVWRIAAEIELVEDDDNPNNFGLDITIQNAIDPKGRMVQVYGQGASAKIRRKLEMAVRAEYWNRVDAACQMSETALARFR